ncbi:MAG: hypothetical protein RIS70_3295 [Planctomycetota bacterium]
MAEVQISCPLCSSLLEVDVSASGMQIECPGCQGVIVVPDLSELQEDASFGSHAVGNDAAGSEEAIAELGCPHCQGLFQVTQEMEGAEVACPHCQQVVTVPAISEAPPEEVTSAPPLTAPAQSSPQPPSPSQPAPSQPAPSQPATSQPATSQPAMPVATGATSMSGGPMQGAPGSESVAEKPGKQRETVVIPTEDGDYVAVREPVKTVGKGSEEIELRRLSPEERLQRRRVTNAIMIFFCLTILILVFMLLKDR